ncbi:invasion associated locus B family protein [Stella sp.]|uniref:invasion associated locus B family protein n=1 Tax=Stella sp. TaxID=2912054 RepID=UPI0035B2A8F9
MMRIAMVGLVLAVVLAAGAAEAQSRSRRGKQPEEQPAAARTGSERIGDWVLRCDPSQEGQAKQCEMAQILSDKDGKRDLLLIRLGYPPNETAALALIVVPLDVLLPPGLGLKVDAREPAVVPIRHCDADGCIAPWRPSADDVQAMKVGKELLVLLRNRDGRQLGLPVSLKGFSAAHDRLR